MTSSPDENPDRKTRWRICLECGDRFQLRRESSSANWCSAKCQTASYRAGRERILESWAGAARWWLR